MYFTIERRFLDCLRLPITFKRWRHLCAIMTLAIFGTTVSLNPVLPEARKFNSFWANDLKMPQNLRKMASEDNPGSYGTWFFRLRT